MTWAGMGGGEISMCSGGKSELEIENSRQDRWAGESKGPHTVQSAIRGRYTPYRASGE